MIKNKKLQMNVITLVLLCMGLCITSFAVAVTVVRYDIQDNYFQTGGIDIDLKGAYNDGKTIVSTDKLLEPGMTIEEEFTITNKGSWDVFYKLYFDKVEGKLGDVLEVTIYKKGAPQGMYLLKGKMSSLVDADELNIADELAAGATQTLIARLHFPKTAGNEYKGETVEFNMTAIAVQTKNQQDPENPKFK